MIALTFLSNSNVKKKFFTINCHNCKPKEEIKYVFDNKESAIRYLKFYMKFWFAIKKFYFNLRGV